MSETEKKKTPSLATQRHALFAHLQQVHGLPKDEIETYYGLTFAEGQERHLGITPHTHTGPGA